MLQPKLFPAEAAPRPATSRRLTAVLLAAAVSMVCTTARAQPFYLRAGIGLDRPAETTFMDRDCSSTSPAALYGCGTGGDGVPYRSAGGFRTAPALEVGLGYVATPAVRLEALVDNRPRSAFEGRANFLEPERRQSVAAVLSSVALMLAAYVDLPALGVPSPGPFRPFIGAGVGAVRTSIGETRMNFPRTTTVVPGDRRTDRAWMVTAGIAAAPAARTTLEFVWRYADLGRVHTGGAEGRVLWHDGSRAPLRLDLAPTRARLRGHGLRLSLRYGF